jgi:F0F1-type ATP synthase epsilon subunit
MIKSRTFKKDEPPIPFHYKFYLIYWEDIQSDSGWRDIKDIQESKPAICVSTGWLVKKDKKVHILMSDYNYDEKIMKMSYEMSKRWRAERLNKSPAKELIDRVEGRTKDEGSNSKSKTD